jgi:hypothetical protein
MLTHRPHLADLIEARDRKDSDTSARRIFPAHGLDASFPYIRLALILAHFDEIWYNWRSSNYALMDEILNDTRPDFSKRKPTVIVN